MTTRYVAIEHYSGFVWGDVIAETPKQACAVIDREADPSAAQDNWEAAPFTFVNECGFHLYSVPADFPPIDDGEDDSQIDLVLHRGKHIGDYRPKPESEDAWAA